MDERLKKALEFSNYQHSLSIRKLTFKEQTRSKLTYGFNGGIFYIDRPLLTFVQMLIDQGRKENIPILDNNDNPIMIDNLESFKDEIFSRYFSVLYEMHEEHEKIKKSRNVEKLLDL